MPEKPLPLNRSLSDAEVEEFRALGLTPGHWTALAPAPLFATDLHSPYPDDLLTLHRFQQPLRLDLARDDTSRTEEAEGFWKLLCRGSVGPQKLDAANALFAWFLATRLPRLQRELYLGALDEVSLRYRRNGRPGTATSPAFILRQRIERCLPHSTFPRYPGDPQVPPPQPLEVVDAFGPDLWKQMLVAPIAAAMTDQQVRPGAAASFMAELAHVTLPSPFNLPSVLESHLAAGNWRRLFVGLLDPLRREEAEPVILSGLRVAAIGLASLPFLTREMLLKAIHEQIVRGIDRADARKITADEWINKVRELVEEVIRQAAPTTTPPPPTMPAPPTSAPIAGPKLPDTPPPLPGVGEGSISAATKVTLPSLPAAPAPKPTVIVQTAEPFAMVTLEEALAQARQTTVADVRAWLQQPKPLLFDDARSECPEVAIVRDSAQVPPTLWLVGDLHADVLTLANLIAHAERVGQAEGVPPAYVFLGDFVDRGRHDHETLLLLYQLVMKDPARVCIIPGNHDVDLQWDEKAGRFRVTIEPAEYCEQLNNLIRTSDSTAAEKLELARLSIGFWQARPKALILPDGTLLAHAGFPHTDMQPLLQTPGDLAKPHCLSDFLWARIAETARKRPNRGNRGHEFGWETFNQFCKASTRIGVPVRRFVRGHDHVPQRWQFFPDYAENPVLTINAMGRRMDGEPDPADGPHPYPVMARHVPNQLPLVVRLPLDAKEVDRAFGRQPPGDTSVGNAACEGEEKAEAKDPGVAVASGEIMDQVIGGVSLDLPAASTPNLPAEHERGSS